MNAIYVISGTAVALNAATSTEILAADTAPRNVRLVSAGAFHVALGGDATTSSLLVPANTEIRLAVPAGKNIEAIAVADTPSVSVAVFSPSA